MHNHFQDKSWHTVYSNNLHYTLNNIMAKKLTKKQKADNLKFFYTEDPYKNSEYLNYV